MRWIPLVLVLGWAGCAGSTQRYQRVHVVGPYGQPLTEPGQVEQVGTCEATLRIRVIDAAFRPLRGARVVARNRVQFGAIEETLATYEYSTHAATTDANGLSRICAPDRLPPPSMWEGIGGGWVNRWRGTVEVSYEGRAATLSPPFPPQVVLR